MVRDTPLPALLLVLLSVACSDEVIQAPDEPAVEVPEAPSGPTGRIDDYLYDAEGQLRESDEVIAGLVLPRGLELDRHAGRRHVYRTSLPRTKLAAYFGPRLFTGAVDRVGGDGAIYRAATVQGVRGSAVRMDVSILPIGGRTRVEVFELPPVPVNPPSPEEMTREARELERAE